MSYCTVKGNLRPLHDKVFGTSPTKGVRKLSSGIILPDDDFTATGIHPRWFLVHKVGEENQDVKVGQYVLVAHGRWTRGFKVEEDDGLQELWMLDPEGILLVSDEKPSDFDEWVPTL